MSSEAITRNDLTEILNDVLPNRSKAYDVVVEQGTNTYGTYRKWESGVLEQWGLEPTASASAHPVYFPTSFVSTAYIVVCSNTSGTQANFMPSTTNVAYFTIFPSANTQVFWIAIGRWK